MNSYSYSVAGFGLIQVMVGIAVMSILSLTFVRKTSNQFDIGVALQLISYRDQVLDYYSALASNRVSWRETRGTNWNSVANNTNIELKDVDGSKRIPVTGLLLTKDNIISGNILPSATPTCPPPTGTPPSYTSDHFCLKATKLASDKLQISVEYRKKDRTVAEMASYLIKPRERDISFWGDTVGKDCGKKAIVGLNLETNSIVCSGHDLITPPCYRTTAGSCGRAGECWDVGYARTSVEGFFSNGQTDCTGGNNILLATSSLPTSPSGIASFDNRGRVTAITGYIAVEPHDCNAIHGGSGWATQGWDSAGNHVGCRKIEKGYRGYRGPRGFRGQTGIAGIRGLTGIKGIQGIWSEPGPTGPKGWDGEQGDSLLCCDCCDEYDGEDNLVRSCSS